MKPIKLLLIVSLCTIPLYGDVRSGDQTQMVIGVSCPDPEGCFRVIERAVEDAPSGAVLKIGAGLYYEKPFTIEKDLTLERAQEGPRPELRFIDRGYGIMIHLRPDGATPMTVTLQGLWLTVQQDEGLLDRVENVGLVIRGIPIDEAQGGAPIDQLRVIIRDSVIVGYGGIGAQGAQLTIESSTITAMSVGIHADFSEVEISDSAISVAGTKETDRVLSLFRTRALIQGNKIIGGGNFGVLLAEGAKSTLMKNTIGHAALLGIFITDDAEVELIENFIVGNERFGIALPLASCAQHPDIRFRGSVSGRDNEFKDNGQDLCPIDYPWPEGFVKP